MDEENEVYGRCPKCMALVRYHAKDCQMCGADLTMPRCISCGRFLDTEGVCRWCSQELLPEKEMQTWYISTGLEETGIREIVQVDSNDPITAAVKGFLLGKYYDKSLSDSTYISRHGFHPPKDGPDEGLLCETETILEALHNDTFGL